MRIKKLIENQQFQLILVVFLGLILRIYGVLSFPVTFDEAHNILLSKVDDTNLIIRVAAEAYPPLFFLIMHLWEFISDNIIFLRALSLAIGVLTIFSIAFVGGKLFNKKVGLISAYLFAISPSQIYYSSIARMYSMAILESVFILYFFFKFLDKKKVLIPLGLFLLLGLYTHYYFTIFLLVLNIYMFLKKKFLKNWLLLNLIITILYIPVISLMLSTQRVFAVPANSILKLPIFLIISVIPWEFIQTLSIFRYNNLDSTSFYAIVLAFIALLFIFIAFKFLTKIKKLGTLIFLYILAPFIILTISFFIFRISNLRSFILFSPIFFIISSLVLSKISKKKSVFILLSFSLITFLFMYNYNLHYLGDNEELRSAYSNFKQEDVVLYNDVILFLPTKILNTPGIHLLMSPGYLEGTAYDVLGIQLSSYSSIPKTNKLWYVRQETNWPPYEIFADELESKLDEDLLEKKRIPYYKFQLIEYETDKSVKASSKLI